MKVIEFFVPGIPAAQGSKRHVGGGRMIESSRQVQPWRAAIAACAPKVEPFTGVVRVELVFSFPRPKSHYGTGKNLHLLKGAAPAMYHAQRPDADKLGRAALDGITQSGMWLDDCQVARLTLVKRWAHPLDQPGMHVRIEALP